MGLPAIQIDVVDFIDFHFEMTAELGRLESQNVGLHLMGPRRNVRSAPNEHAPEHRSQARFH